MNSIIVYRGAYNVTSRRKDGARYIVQVTPRGYIVDGVTFATIAAALAAATYRKDGERS